MEAEDTNIDGLLVKKLLGESSAEEELLIADWLSKGQEQRQYYNEFDRLWEESSRLSRKSKVNEAEAWERFKARVNEPKEKHDNVRNDWMAVFRIAAGLVFLVGAGWLFFLLSDKFRQEPMAVRQSGEKTMIVTLPDGTTVSLNKNTTLRYPESFSGESRKVALSGEAFFDVTPDKVHPFIIEAGEVQVRVVGTSFNVKEKRGSTEVVVETGVVEVAHHHRMIRLKPEEQAVVSSGSGSISKARAKDHFHDFYRTGKLVCNDTPLLRLTETLSEIYGTDIVLDNESLGRMPINTTFDNLNLEQTLDLIAVTLNLQVVRNGDKITLRK